jgi:hypothetical protein
LAILQDELKINMGTIFFLQPIAAVAAGILILVRPQLLNYIVAFYFILSGILGLFNQL